jgi:hypothetical protein
VCWGFDVQDSWCVDACVDALMALCWCVDDIVWRVGDCWCVGDVVLMCGCVGAWLVCWWLCDVSLLCWWLCLIFDSLMTVLTCWWGDVRLRWCV